MTAAGPIEAPIRKGRRKRRRRAARAGFAEPVVRRGDPDTDLHEQAHERAHALARLTRKGLQYVVVVGVLWLVVKPVAIVVGILWGISLAREAGRKVVEPALRRRWVEREVRRGLRRAVPEQRREIEGRHTRRVEEIAAGVAHEIRNPITAARSLVQQMGEDPASPQNVEYASVALQELARVERSISHLLRFAREQEPQLETCALAEIVDSALETLRPRLEATGVDVVRDVPSQASLRADPEQLRRALLNLVGNAVDALAQAGTADPRIEVQGGANLAGDELWLRVRDNGPGIDPAHRQRLFRPFFTAKPGGTGLGLALAKKVVEGHAGRLELEEPQRGASFLITLPRDPLAAEAPR